MRSFRKEKEEIMTNQTTQLIAWYLICMTVGMLLVAGAIIALIPKLTEQRKCNPDQLIINKIHSQKAQ